MWARITQVDRRESVVNEREFSNWWDTNFPILTRAEVQLRTTLEAFVEDWADGYGFRVDGTKITTRVKSGPRLLEKLRKKGEIADRLFVDPFPVRDVVGARVVVRSLADAVSLRTAINENFFPKPLKVDDRLRSPSVTGYRAVHADLVVPITMRGSETKVPCELQVKTLAQDTWGAFTHEGAYSRTDINKDARFQHVRELQRVLADHLDCVDQLQGEIERQANDLLTAISAETGDHAAITEVTILNHVFSNHRFLMSLASAQIVAENLVASGLQSVDELADVLSLDGPRAVNASDAFKERERRKPTPEELVRELSALQFKEFQLAGSPSSGAPEGS